MLSDPGPRALVAIVLLVVAAPAAAVQLRSAAAGAMAAAAATPATGQRLRDALNALRDAGLDLAFSDALVSAEFRVAQPVDPDGDLRRQALAMLEPFGLGLARASTGLWYVVRARASEPAQAPPVDGVQDAPPVLETMVVSAPRYRLVRGPRERRALDHETLRIVPALGRDAMRAVSLLPGQASVGVSARHHMRGGDTNEVLYLLDGVEWIEPFHLSDFQGVFSALNPSLVDSVDVYHAGFPVAFGSRLSGIVGVALVEPERPLQGRVDVDLVSASAQAAGYAGEVSWLASVRRSLIDEVFHLLEQDYGEPSFLDGLLRLQWQSERAAWTWGAFNASDELTLDDPTAGESAKADYHNTMTWLRGEHRLSDAVSTDVTVSYTEVDNEREGTLDDAVDAVGALTETREFRVVSGDAGVRWQPGARWSVHAGAHASWQRGVFDVAMASDFGLLGAGLQTEPLRRTVQAERDGSLYGVFASVGFEPTDRLHLEAGARYDMQDIDPVHDAEWSPRLHVRYRGRAGWTAFVDVGRYTQYQNLYELQLDDGLLELNPPQYGNQLSVGVDLPWHDGWRFGVEAYGRRVRDPWQRFDNLYNPWVLLPELHADRVRITPERARAHGVELSLDYEPDQGPRWSLSYSVARSRERIDGRWQSRPWEQTSTGRVTAAWQPGRWDLGMAVTYHSGWPTTARVTGPDDDVYDERLPDYVSLDLHVARRFELPRSELQLYLDVGNATDAVNVGGYRYEIDDGRLDRKARRLLPRLPVIGLSWTW